MKVVQNKNNKLFSGRRNSSVDRRRLENQRTLYSMDYFSKGGMERREMQDRRKQQLDRRKSWVRVSQWSSVYVDPGSSPESSWPPYHCNIMRKYYLFDLAAFKIVRRNLSAILEEALRTGDPELIHNAQINVGIWATVNNWQSLKKTV